MAAGAYLSFIDSRRFNQLLPSASPSSFVQILRDQLPTLGAPTACLLDQNTRYDLVASGWGAKGLLCEDLEQTKAAISEAQEEVKKEGTAGACLNVLIAKSDFREGSISV